jgi:pantetheine-phosphate adenylyltransferase
MRKAIYPGTFDPITHGHLDLLQRAKKMFDEVVIAIAADGAKTTLFSMEERRALIEQAVKEARIKATVNVFSGLLVDYVRQQQACAVIRGLRAVSDFEFEFQLALMNRKLNDDVETIFLMPKDAYTYLSSSIVKEISRLGGDISSFVPKTVETALKAKWKK